MPFKVNLDNIVDYYMIWSDMTWENDDMTRENDMNWLEYLLFGFMKGLKLRFVRSKVTSKKFTIFFVRLYHDV